MHTLAKKSAPTYRVEGTPERGIANDAATIIPFERGERPTAGEKFQRDRFMTGVGVGASAALAAVMVVMYVWALPLMESAVESAQQPVAAAQHA